MTVVQTSKTCVIPQSSSFFSYSGCALIAKPVRSAKCQHIFSFYFFLAFLSKTLLPLGSDLCIFFFFSSDFALVQRPRRSLNSALFCLLFWSFVVVACKLYYITYTFPSLFIIHLKKWHKLGTSGHQIGLLSDVLGCAPHENQLARLSFPGLSDFT